MQDAATWLSYTYLHVRMLINPGLYGVGLTEKETDRTLQVGQIMEYTACG